MREQAMRRRARHTGIRVALGTVTMIIIVALFAVLLLFRPLPALIDSTERSGGDTYAVSQLRIRSYCPSRMVLADSGTYGDAEFQASSGDIASSARYAAFGSVFHSIVGTVADTSTGTELSADGEGIDSVLTASGDVDKNSTLMETRLLESQTGTGAAGSTASWATSGDLKGVSASSCIAPALTQDFVIAGTRTGTTQQLVVANPSSKATSLSIRAWGTSQSGPITLSTEASVTVAAYGETTVDLAAAAPNQDGLYVTVSSGQTPVAAVVRTVASDGLTAKGSDFVIPSASATTASVMPSVREGDAVRVMAFAERDTEATLSWVSDQGTSEASFVRLEGGKVTVIDLGDAPKGVLAVSATSQSAVTMTAQITRSGGDGQSDFALIPAETASESSAVVMPEQLNGELTLANVGDTDAEGTLTGYDSTGNTVGSQTVRVPAGSARKIAPSDIGDGAVIFLLDDPDANIVWGLRANSASVDDAGVAGVAALSPTSLAAVTEQVWSSQNSTIVR